MRLRWTLLPVAALLVGLVAAAAPAQAVNTAAAAAPYCGITWGSTDKAGGSLSTAALLDVRTGQHDCYDRVVFEFNGPANGFAVNYGDVYTDGEGFLVTPYLAGGATLNVVLRGPAYDPNTGVVTYPRRSGDHVANVLRYRTLRDVMFVSSYEGYTTVGVGVRARLPFRVSVLSGPGSHSRIVLDVAHQWEA